jgi:hypothetical protein
MATDFSSRSRSTGLVDVLDRVLDKGLVIAGDIRVSLAEVELLTIRIRLIVCSLDKAEAIGLDWWKHDQYLAPGRNTTLAEENAVLRRELRALEERVAALSVASESLASEPPARSRALRSIEDDGAARGRGTGEGPRAPRRKTRKKG